MKIYVGSSSFRGSVQRFGFDLLELGVGPTLPRPKVLTKYREERADLVYSLRLGPEVALAGPHHPDVTRAAEAVEALGARFVVISTSPRFAPSPSRKGPLLALREVLAATGATVCWEPRGVWNPGETVRWATEAGLLLVRDLSQESAPPGELVYTRLLPLGLGARVTSHALEVLVERLESVNEAYVVIQGEGAKAARTQLLSWFGEEPA